MKVSARLDAANLIPGNKVAQAFANLQVAVWANPGLTIVGVCTDAGLGDVFNATLYLAAAQSEADGAEIYRFNGFNFGFATPWSIAAWH